MWINYQFMAVCPLILIFLHIYSQKWLYFWPPKLFTPTGQFFYTNIFLTFSNSGKRLGGYTRRLVRIISSPFTLPSRYNIQMSTEKIWISNWWHTYSINFHNLIYIANFHQSADIWVYKFHLGIKGRPPWITWEGPTCLTRTLDS